MLVWEVVLIKAHRIHGQVLNLYKVNSCINHKKIASDLSI